MRGKRSYFAVLFGILALASNAAAEGPKGSIALDQLSPPPPGDPFFGTQSPFIGGHLVPRGQVVFDYANRPLTLTSGAATGAVVASQSFLHLGASFALWDRLLVSLQLPIAVSQGGDSPAVRNVMFDSPTEAQVGDLRAGVRVRIVGQEGDAGQLGVGVNLHVPTGPSNSYVSDGFVRLEPQLLLGGRRSLFQWSLSLGAHVRGAGNPSAVTGGFGAGVSLLGDRLQINVEAFAATLFQEGTFRITEQRSIPRETLNTNAELLGGVRVRLFESLVAGAAAGPGLTQGLGTPDIRVVGSIAWAPSATEKGAEGPGPDADGDGIVGAEDACPYSFGVKNADPKRNGCPKKDADGDGFEDAEDACQEQTGVASTDPKKNGCPPDKDDDGVPDDVDVCPDEAGVSDMSGCPADADRDGVPDTEDACKEEQGPKSDDPKKSGCPGAGATSSGAAPKAGGDSDGDGVADAADACPLEKGPASSKAQENGCPKFVRVKGDEITLLSPIRFGVSRNDPAPLDKSANAILEDVASVMAQHPEFLKVEVQAHSDNDPAGANISKARAEKVMKWLTEHGVSAERLVAKGYGSTKPIADNSTAAGKAKNKRIEIVVIERKK